MFRQEIKNVNIIKNNWCRNCYGTPKFVDYKEYYHDSKKLTYKRTLLDPEKINPFIMKLIDPFKEEYDNSYTINLENCNRNINNEGVTTIAKITTKLNPKMELETHSDIKSIKATNI